MFIQCSFITDVDNGFNNETHTTAEYIKYIFHIKNDISPRRYDIRLAPYDIFSCEKYDIISVPSYTAGVYHTEGISSILSGTDIIEKSTSYEVLFSWCG